jgi:hypothetical protein
MLSISTPARKISRSLWAIVLVATVVALSGCGENSGDDPPAAAAVEQRELVRAARAIEAADPPLSRAQFVTRVNKLCRLAWPEIRRRLAVYRSTQDPELSAQRRFEQGVARSLLPEIKSRIFDPMLALGTPTMGRSELEEIMRWLGEAIEIGQGEFAINSPFLVWDLFDMFNPLARQYGLGNCLVNTAHTRFEE